MINNTSAPAPFRGAIFDTDADFDSAADYIVECVRGHYGCKSHTPYCYYMPKAV